MSRPVIVFLTGLVSITTLNAAAAGEWAPSTLSDSTIAKAQEAKVSYQQCLDEQIRKHLMSNVDSRAITDAILKACEDRLSPIRTAYDAEKVPPSITDRYLRQQRSRAAQDVLREIMAAQAVRQGGKE
jgi:hypothetical protein